MARNNFQYEKRQRELEKKRKADEKSRRKNDAKSSPESADGADGADAPEGQAQPDDVDAQPEQDGGQERSPAAPSSIA